MIPPRPLTQVLDAIEAELIEEKTDRIGSAQAVATRTLVARRRMASAARSTARS